MKKYFDDTMHKVSAIIPVYNRSKHLADAFNSVLAQSYPVDELIIVNDGSTQEHRQKILELVKTTSIARLISLDKNKGTANARNLGAKSASYPIIAFLDSDDTWKPDRIARHLEVFLKTGVNISACTAEQVGSNNIVERRTLTPIRSLKDLVAGCRINPGSTLLCKREVYLQSGGQDMQYRRLEDWEWLIRLVQMGETIHTIEDCLVNVHQFSYSPDDTIMASLQKISEEYSSVFFQHSLADGLAFKSHLMIERAYSSYVNGFKMSGVVLGIVAIAIWPIRGLQFWFRAGRFLKKHWKSGASKYTG